MTAQAKPSKFLRLALGGVAFAALMTSGTVVGKASPAEARAQLAQQALAKGKVDRAIGHAEQAVAASPRDPAMRLVLAQAYLKAGRFESAAATFNDAMDLGDTSPRTARTRSAEPSSAIRVASVRSSVAPSTSSNDTAWP